MTDKKYQGWENWETWVTHLWLTNDEGTCNMAKECKTPEALKDMVAGWAEEKGLLDKGMFTDFILGALADVYWQEIWEALNETD